MKTERYFCYWDEDSDANNPGFVAQRIAFGDDGTRIPGDVDSVPLDAHDMDAALKETAEYFNIDKDMIEQELFQ